MKIGITYTGRDDKHANYVKWIKGNDPDIEVIKLSATEQNDLETLDGLVLSGGIDMHPRFYNGNEKYNNMPAKFKEERDSFEMNAFDSAIKNNIPVLGVCRGLQLINVFQKGTLVQDLADKNDIHRDNERDKTHNVSIAPDTFLSSIINESSGTVNSAHHQAINNLGNNLVPNSYSDDGIIEGIEWKNKNSLPFMIAVQWHPERMDQSGLMNSPFSKNLRDKFISEVKSRHK